MRSAIVALLAWALGGTALGGKAFAASVTLHPNGNLVVLEGQIAAGDYDKVEKIAREAMPTGIYLASPGGNLAEALRIGTLVRRLAWETRSAEGPDVAAPIRTSVALAYGVRDPARNNLCTSACFFIFVAGIYRDGHSLGIHRPFMAPGEAERLAPEDVPKLTDKVRFVVEVFLQRMGVPSRYADAMYDVPSDRMRWLTPEEIAADFSGFVPQVREWVKTQCGDEDRTLRCKEAVMTGIHLRTLEQNAR